jgi:hypothetical protein
MVKIIVGVIISLLFLFWLCDSVGLLDWLKRRKGNSGYYKL